MFIFKSFTRQQKTLLIKLTRSLQPTCINAFRLIYWAYKICELYIYMPITPKPYISINGHQNILFPLPKQNHLSYNIKNFHK